MIGKWHISEEHKRFCELASGLGKMCCFQEREGGMQSPLVPQDWAGSSFGVGCGAVIPPCSQSPPGWQCWFWVEAAELWDCPNPSELALIFIAFFAWALHFFLQLKIPWCSEGSVRRGVSLWYLWPSPVSVSWSVQSRGAPVPSGPSLGTASPSWVHPGWQRPEAEGTRSHDHGVPRDRIHLLLPGTFCCSDQWCEFHDLCTCMNFAVHPSGSSAFTFTVYFLVCLIRWLCWLYLNSLYFYAGF